MSRAATVNVSMPQSMRSYIKRRMGKGGFGNLSEYVRHLVREDQQKEAEKELAAMIAEGMASGPPERVTPQWVAERKAELKRRIARGRRR